MDRQLLLPQELSTQDGKEKGNGHCDGIVRSQRRKRCSKNPQAWVHSMPLILPLQSVNIYVYTSLQLQNGPNPLNCLIKAIMNNYNNSY